MTRITRLAREGSSSYHGNVTWTAPFSTSLRKRSGVMRSDAIPHSSFPREGSVNKHRNVRRSTPFPTSYRGSVLDRRNAKDDSPPPVLGHLNHAAMLISKRPINFNQRPPIYRRNAFYRTPRNQGDPIWIQDMKTRLSHK